MSKKPFLLGLQTRKTRGSYVAVYKDAKTGQFVTRELDPVSGGAKPKPKVEVKPVPLDPDAFMDYLLEEDAVIMEHLAK